MVKDERYDFLEFVDFAKLKNWDYKSYLKSDIISKYEVVSLGKVIKHQNKKEKLSLYPEEEFGVLGISNEIGMFDAYKEKGKNIKQSYKIVEEGFIAYNPYRINVGSMGIKTRTVKNTYISSAYVVFSCTEKIKPEFLYLLMKTDNFNKQVIDNTTGSVRQTLSFESLSKIKIPLPPLKVQEKIVNQYNLKINQAEEKEKEAKQIKKDIEKYLFNELGIVITEKNYNKNKYNYLSFIDFSKLSRWEKDEINQINSIYDLKKLKDILYFVNRGWKKTYLKEKFNYIEIGSIEPNLGITKTTEIFTEKAPSRATQQVKTGDLIIGTTRPYLKKFAIVEEDCNDYICSSGFQVIEKSIDYNLYYILFVLQSEFCIKQFEYFMTGALYPAINKSQLEDIMIPFPSIEIQNKIANEIIKRKTKIKYLEKDIEILRENAKQVLQNEIFEKSSSKNVDENNKENKSKKIKSNIKGII